jgi:hypothetical protein
MLVEFDSPPTRPELEELVRQSQPALLRRLFDADPIRRVDTVEAARAALGRLSLEVEICDEQFLETGVSAGRSTTSLAGWLDRRTSDPIARCFAQPTPPPLRELARSFVDPSADPSDSSSLLFLARGGQSSHLHFDDDQRDVILYQVFGRKRFVLIHPRETHKLAPYVSPLGFTTAGIYLENMSPEDRAAYLAWTHAIEVVLEPGSAVFIPRMYWHYAGYDETAMSVTFRLGRTEAVRRFALGTPAPGVTVQALAMELADDARVTSGDRAPLAAELRAALDGARDGRIFGVAQEHAFGPIAARWLARPPRADHVEHLYYRHWASAAARCAEERPAPSAWSSGDRPMFARGLALLAAHRTPAPDAPLWLLQDHRLLAELAFPEPWAHAVLVRIGTAKGAVTVGELAGGTTPIARVAELLGELGARGWLVRA